MIPLSMHAPLTGFMLLMMVGAIASGRIAIDVAVVGTVMVLLITGVITPEEAVHGYSNTALATIGFLYVVAAGLRETGAIGMMSKVFLGNPKTVFGAQARLVPTVAFISAFANNTPIVATFIPALIRLSRRTGIPVGRLLIPLSFAAILGGLCTLIGTSTTLVVAGLLREFGERHPEQVTPQFFMFTVTPVGLVVAVVGVAYVLVFGRTLLRGGREAPITAGGVREYTAGMRVRHGSPVVGRTIEAAGLRQLPSLFLSRIEREGETIIAVSPQEVLREGDVLVFVGVLDSLKDLREVRGLEPVVEDEGRGLSEMHPHYATRANLRLVEAVVASASPLVGRTIRESGIRTQYRAVVVAVHRHGHQLKKKIGDIILRPGDTLLLETQPGFARHYRDSTDFYLVSEIDEPAGPRHERAWVALGILAGFVLMLGAGQVLDLEGIPGWLQALRPLRTVMTPMPAAMLAAGLMLFTRCCRGVEARRAIDWQVLIVIGSAFALGAAMEQSGLAETLAKPMIALSGMLGPVGSLAAVYAVTVLCTTFVTHAAAAVLMFPIAYQVATSQELPVLPFAVIVAMAASAEFTTPIGYQTNLMVMGPGGYRFMDFVRFGGPLTVLSGIVAVTAASLWFNL